MDLVILKDRQAVTSSLKVAEVFEKGHQHVLRDIDNLKKDLSNFGQMFAEGAEPDSYGRDRRVYYMNRDGFTLLAMGFTGKEALKFKLKYIEAFNAMEAEIKKAHLSSYMIADPIKRAEKWIEEETLRKEQAAEIERMRPKEIFSDAITASNTSILVGDLAKILKGNGVDIGQKRLFNWMRENGYLIKGQRSDRNMPTQRSMDMGLFEIKESSYISGDGVNHITKTPKVTGKGQKYFVNKFLQAQEAEE
ncbi:phage regulatory protein/antirepressor Ant [Eubacterium pyruvativorans]|uniref:phage regulatory protein/antirepressor Ant n=1 Tax=Eubacterium pyruvativorans TaxID=155865 RepID=UPI003F8BF287